MTKTRSNPRPRAALPPPFEADRRAVDRYLARRLARLPGVPTRLARAMRHAALAPGKRVRPLLVLLGYDAVGGDARARAAMLPAAAALEFVHAFSLAHDDLPAGMEPRAVSFTDSIAIDRNRPIERSRTHERLRSPWRIPHSRRSPLPQQREF